MASKPSRIKSGPSQQAGFTLVEILIATALGGMLLAVCLTMMLHTSTSMASAVDYVDLNARSRYAIDRMSQKLRQATSVNSRLTNSISVTYKGQPLTYTNNANLKTLVENENGNLTTILANCDTLKFDYYMRNPLTNAFNQFPVLVATNKTKVVQVTWSCSRMRVGKKSGSGTMSSAKIVIRAK